jgi:hypothetical protein
VMPVGEATSVTDEVLVWGRNQGAQLGEDWVGRHDDAASLARQVEADS